MSRLAYKHGVDLLFNVASIVIPGTRLHGSFMSSEELEERRRVSRNEATRLHYNLMLRMLESAVRRQSPELRGPEVNMMLVDLATMKKAFVA